MYNGAITYLLKPSPGMGMRQSATQADTDEGAIMAKRDKLNDKEYFIGVCTDLKSAYDRTCFLV
jgi:hypothetical protein